MKKISLVILLFCTGLFVFAAGSQENKAGFSGDYAFGGSTTVEPIVLAAIEEFTEVYPDVRISYDSQGSSVGVKGVLSGIYSLGGASRELKSSETESGAKSIAIALDGVAVIVNKESVNLDNLTLEDTAKIFAGEITNWKEVGGADSMIVVFNRDEASGTRDCFNGSVIKKMKKKFTNAAAIVTSNGDMVSKVGSTPNAIGYCGFGYISKNPGTKAISVNTVLPEMPNVLNKTYPVSRQLNIVYKGTLAEGSLEKAFVDYLLSKDGQIIVKEEKFIPLN